MTIENLKKEFPNLIIKDLSGGANVYLPGEMVLTFWFKKRKWKSNKRKDWRRFTDMKDAFSVISALGDVQIKKTVTTNEITPINNTQLCINHINKKIATIEKIKPNSAALMILKQLTLELQQYL